MILNRKDLQRYLDADASRNPRISIKKILLQNEDCLIIRQLKALRKYEYFLNSCKSTLSVCGVLKLYYLINYRRLTVKTQIYISPNTIGPGLKIVHPGFRRVDIMVKAGSNLTLLPMVLFGKKRPGEKGTIVIGDNCYIGTGATILGPCTIGDNVVIGAGAVVCHDIPNDTIVAGVPARPIKINE